MKSEQGNASTQGLQSYENMIGSGKERIDAIFKANVILVKGLQALNSQFFSITAFSLQNNAEATKKLFACNSSEEFFAIQNDLA